MAFMDLKDRQMKTKIIKQHYINRNIVLTYFVISWLPGKDMKLCSFLVYEV